MDDVSKARFEEINGLIRKMQDAITRANDGMSLERWESKTCGYAQGQLLRANAWIVKALVMFNDEVNERSEAT